MSLRLVGGMATEAAIIIMLVYWFVSVLILLAICLVPKAEEEVREYDIYDDEDWNTEELGEQKEQEREGWMDR